ncbi:MAG: DinB family protein [Aggregatilineales bacterium]
MSDIDTPPTRADLLRQIQESWNELQTVVASLTEEQLTRSTDAAGWTVKDHLIHLSIWEIGGTCLARRQIQT